MRAEERMNWGRLSVAWITLQLQQYGLWSRDAWLELSVRTTSINGRVALSRAFSGQQVIHTLWLK